MFPSVLQESPSLWHFTTTRPGQKTTSASGKEKGSRLSTARKSLQLLIRLPTLRRNAGFQFYPPVKGAAGRSTCRGGVFQLGQGKEVFGVYNLEQTGAQNKSAALHFVEPTIDANKKTIHRIGIHVYYIQYERVQSI